MALGPERWDAVRARLTDLLCDPAHRTAVEPALVPVAACTLHLPVTVADYVDFYSSIEHATNLGRLFRPDAEPLLPNWRHLPVAYHGRAGTVVVSGTPVPRPAGQRRVGDGVAFGPSERLDIELEVGHRDRGAVDSRAGVLRPMRRWTTSSASCWSTTGRPATSRPGSTSRSGPFLGKSFATTMSAWVTPLAALRACRTAGPGAGPAAVAVPAARRRLGARPAPVRRRAAGRCGRGRDRQPHVVRGALLAGAAADRPPDGQRRPPPHRRPPGVGHGVRGRAGHRGQPDRADPRRRRPAHRGRGHAHVPRGRRRGGAAGLGLGGRRGDADPRRGGRAHRALARGA